MAIPGIASPGKPSKTSSAAPSQNSPGIPSLSSVDARSVLSELIAIHERLHAILDQLAGTSPTLLSVTPTSSLDLAARDLLVDGRPVRLEKLWFDFLALLAQRRGTVVSRADATALVWRQEHPTRAMDQAIVRFRQLLGARSIRTVNAVGWILEA